MSDIDNTLPHFDEVRARYNADKLKGQHDLDVGACLQEVLRIKDELALVEVKLTEYRGIIRGLAILDTKIIETEKILVAYKADAVGMMSEVQRIAYMLTRKDLE